MYFDDVYNMKRSMNTSNNDLIQEFYYPCLRWASNYDRAVGYFTSSWIQANCEGLSQFVKKNGHIRWITSPIVSEQDYKIFESIVKKKSESAALERILSLKLEDIKKELSEKTQNTIAWLIDDNILDFKFAIPVNKLDGDFHDKFGIFYGEKPEEILSYTGSINDSKKGLSNYESIKIFKSWVDGNIEIIAEDISRFNDLWQGNDHNIKIYTIPEAIRGKIIRLRNDIRPYDLQGSSSSFINKENKWRHQDEALQIFINKNAGILEMATGTGKTKTALKIIYKLFYEKKIDQVIVTTYGNDLLDQWCEEVYKEKLMESYILKKHYRDYKELGNFYTSPKNKILVVSRNADILYRLFIKLDLSTKSRTLIIFDEIHGLGSESLRTLMGQINPFGYRLGLSATPEREYDEIGNGFILDEVGEVIYSFGIEEAIKRKILCEFDYTTLNYELTTEEKEKIRALRISAEIKRKNGEYVDENELKRNIAKVRKKALMKIDSLESYIINCKNILQNCIIFVEDIEYGQDLQTMLFNYSISYHTYYAGTEKNNLDLFAKGKIDTLITCEKLNEGIDIKTCKAIILVSSDKSKLTTIQRIGRCLRINPGDLNKRAMVIDFIDETSNTDCERRNWISTVAKVGVIK